jgi:acetate---CoA ligase (ADP-forming)
VHEMVDAGTEMIVGMSRDPQFGPVVACGLGGVFVETLRDTALLLPPVREGDARAALERLRGYPLLQGVRGAKPADQAALLEVVRRFAELCADLGPLVEAIDINPLVVFEAGRGACAVDCLIVPAAHA